MADFIATVGDRGLRQRLGDAIEASSEGCGAGSDREETHASTDRRRLARVSHRRRWFR
jgi:hypothetical protein